jgi:hypothetical protein
MIQCRNVLWHSQHRVQTYFLCKLKKAIVHKVHAIYHDTSSPTL